MSFLLRLTSAFKGRQVGTDRFGNTYYESRRKQPVYDRTRRWVLYAKAVEATAVPPEWHAWLHHTSDALPEQKMYPWQLEHQPNLTGTPAAYRPAGHDYQGGQRAAAGADYEAWTPGA
jgi:NADH:ubiquinone oxidoreductase subunit